MSQARCVGCGGDGPDMAQPNRDCAVWPFQGRGGYKDLTRNLNRLSTKKGKRHSPCWAEPTGSSSTHRGSTEPKQTGQVRDVQGVSKQASGPK